MPSILKLDAVTERDIDLLLLEEFNVSPEFAAWFSRMITSEETLAECEGAWRSIVDGILGESDLLVRYASGLVILIENKIDAVAQREQGNRYRQRGQKGIQDGHWHTFLTCMVAPARYLERQADASSYDTTVSYEQLSDWFANQPESDRRSQYRSELIQLAISQERRGYCPNPDSAVTKFWFDYWQLVKSQFPHLPMRKPTGRPSSSDWIYFPLPELSATWQKRVAIVHKLARGFVDLQIDSAASLLPAVEAAVDDESVSVVAAGNSAAIRILVPPADRFAELAEQSEAVHECLAAVSRLLQLSKESDRLVQLLAHCG